MFSFLLSHPEYCTRYYRCSHGIDELFECPRDTAWDEMTTSCAWIDQVNCDQKILGYSTSTPSEGMIFFRKLKSNYTSHFPAFLHISIDTTTSNKYSDTDSLFKDPILISSISGTNKKDNSGNPPVIECQPTGIYLLPDLADCSRYYQCDKGVQTKLNCTDRRLFDIEKHECHEYERVDCGSRPISPVEKNQCKLIN